MNIFHIKNYEYMANEFAKETHINEEKKEYFLKGVEWAFDAIISTMQNSTHPMADDSTNARLKAMAWKDVKESIMKLREIKK